MLQWLLPIFAADFPLFLSLRLLDLVVLGGLKCLLQAALALLEAIQGPAANAAAEAAAAYAVAHAAAAAGSATAVYAAAALSAAAVGPQHGAGWVYHGLL